MRASHHKVITFLCLQGALFANPTGLEVQLGQAAMQMINGHTCVIESSPHAILNWQDFSIAQGECLKFIQESSHSTAINRVIGPDSSQLLGALQSNGAVYVINPNGLYIGPNALIQTAGFIASTADILDADLLTFTNPGDGKIINKGIIRCPKGDIIFIAKTIENEGTLEGNFVALAAADEMHIRPRGEQRILIRSQDTDFDNPYEKAINHSGTIKAFATKEENGRVYLIADDVHLADEAHIEALQGEVYIGGGFQGKDSNLVNSQITKIEPGVTIVANAIDEGDGGKVIIWSDGDTFYHGYIQSLGGETSGDGGFVEISGHENLVYRGTVDLSASNGKCGHIVLDPKFVTVVSGGGAASSTTFAPAGGTITMDGGSLGTLLGSASVTLEANTDVTIDDTVPAGVGGNNLTLNAGRSVVFTVTGILTLTGGDLTVTINDALAIGADRDPGTAVFSMPVGSSITTGGGDVTVTGGTFGGSVVTRAAISGSITTGVGNISITNMIADSFATISGISLSSSAALSSTSGNITLTGTGGGVGGGSHGIELLGASTIASTSGSVNLMGTGRGSSTTNDGIHIEGGSTITTTTGMASITGISGSVIADNAGVRVTGASSRIGTISGNMTITGMSTGSDTSNQGVIITAGGTISSTGSGGTLTLNGTGSTGSSDCQGIFISGAGSNITASGGGNLSLTGVGFGIAAGSNQGILLEAAAAVTTTSGNITMNGTGSIVGTTTNQGIQITGASTVVTSADGNISLTGVGGGTTTLNHGIAIDSSASVTSTGITPGGTITLNGTGSTSGTSSNNGISIFFFSSISSVNGDISMTGTGGGTATFGGNDGILVTSFGTVTGTGTAGVAMVGNGGTAGLSLNNGINISGTSVTTASGPISFTGTGGGTGTLNHGIQIEFASTVSSSGTGTVAFTGTGSTTGTGTSRGIHITGASSVGTGGAISFTGTGGGTGTLNHGINIDTASTVSSSGAGILTFTGTGSSTGTSTNLGINITDVTTAVSSAGGSISLTGTGGGTTTDNEGVLITSSAAVTAPSGIAFTGTGGPGTTGNNGIHITGVTLTTATGDFTFDGTGSGTGGDNVGIFLDGSGVISSSGSGTITMTGRSATVGPNSWGIEVSTGAITSISTGALSITGIGQGTNEEGILIDTGGTITSFGSGPLSVATQSDMMIQDGGSISSTGTGAVAFKITRDLSISGGSGGGAASFIGLIDGDGSFTIGRDLLITGGTGLGSHAQIGSQGLVATANMIFDVSGNITLNGTSTNSHAMIGHGSPVSGGAHSGDITITRTGGDTLLQGANTAAAGTQGFSQIGHVNTNIDILSGNITILSERSITVVGGSAAATAYAIIGHGKPSVGTVSTSTMQLIANLDVNITASIGDAVIQNLASTVDSGNLTLVVDNLFPFSQGIGLGEFNIGSTLTATGELRIYTAKQDQNMIDSGINGATFSQGIVGVDNATHKWSIYFPDGTYGGPEFTFYYKVPFGIPNSIFENIMANLTALNNLLPVLQRPRLDIGIPSYHLKTTYVGKVFEYDMLPITSLIFEEEVTITEPGFSPYGSFIFEDYIYWVGLKWNES